MKFCALTYWTDSGADEFGHMLFDSVERCEAWLRSNYPGIHEDPSGWWHIKGPETTYDFRFTEIEPCPECGDGVYQEDTRHQYHVWADFRKE